jgi:cell division protein FtsI (penicillin-binding protein 3)
MTGKGSRWRIGALILGVLCIFTGLGARLAFLHLGPNDHLLEHIAQLRHTERTILAERGRVLDRHGHVLAMDLAVKDVWIDPSKLQNYSQLDFMINHLVRILHVDPAVIRARASKAEREYEYVKRYVQRDVAEQLARMQFKGLHFDDALARHYPQGSLMSHVIGYSNVDGVGSAGIEQRWNDSLKGRNGLRISERDGRRAEMYARRTLDLAPRHGADVELTLDQNLQFMMEEALDRGLAKYGGLAAWAIMMRVQTGEILAMASRPSFDLNRYGKASDEERRNRAIAFNYEPGSTFKVAVIAAAFNEGLIHPDQIVDCENGHWMYRGRPLRDYKPNGLLSVADVLKKSSNIGAAKIALMLPEDRFEKYLRDFGFGARTGIDLPGEEPGILSGRSAWSAISVSRIAMGHEVAVTGLQLLNSVNAMANNGFLMRPYVVRRVVDKDGLVLHEGAPHILGRPIREDTAKRMTRLLARVTEEGGTGRAAHLENYTVAGKTGTAQKPIPGGYADRQNYASFVGYLPAEQPEISIVVIVDDPQPVRTGGGVAAPIFKDIAAEAVQYLNIPSSVRSVQQLDRNEFARKTTS